MQPPNFEFKVISDAGHSLNTHCNAHESLVAMERWLERVARTPDAATAVQQ